MEKVDAQWIQERLGPNPPRGRKADLARHMGINQNKLTKILHGSRQIQANELPLVLDYFGEAPLSEREKHVLRLFRKIPLDRQGEAEKILEVLGEKEPQGE